MYKWIFNSVLFFVVMMIIFFFMFTDSYKLSLEAKLKYISGEYVEANTLAKEAFELDPYNRMAISILAQSQISIQMADYVKDAREYLHKIELLSEKGDFSHRDKIKIKMMCEVMIGRYKKLNPTVMTDKALYAECTKNYQHFEKLYEKLFPKKA